MSLAIDINAVTDVLLADGWHSATANSFKIDAYEFIDGEQVLHGGQPSGITSVGFTFVDGETAQRLSGPLTSVLAVQTRRT